MAEIMTTIDRKKWEENLASVEHSKEVMNTLVMNFLLTEGYVEAARKFHLESGTKHISLTTSVALVEIRKAILSGNVEDALNRIDRTVNLEILNTNTELCWNLHQQWCIELIRNNKIEEALKLVQKELRPRASRTLSYQPDFSDLLEETLALFDFPTSNLLDLSRRRKIANEVDAAVLISENLEKVRITGATRSLLRVYRSKASKLTQNVDKGTKATGPRIPLSSNK